MTPYQDFIATAAMDAAIKFKNEHPNCDIEGPMVETYFNDFFAAIENEVKAKALDEMTDELDNRVSIHQGREGFAYGLEFAAALMYRRAHKLREGK